MMLLETLALLTLIITVIHGTVDITLQVLQYIDGKHDKRDRPPSLANSRSQSLLILMIGYGS